jgi:hypothetical protein
MCRPEGIIAAFATLERFTRELGAALVAFEQYLERQIELPRGQERRVQMQVDAVLKTVLTSFVPMDRICKSNMLW